MKLSILGTGVLGVLVGVAATIPNGLSGDSTKTVAVTKAPSYTQMNDPKFQIDLMDRRVTDLEAKLGALQKQLAQSAAHTHSYRAPQCVEFVSLLNLQAAINNPGAHAGMGVCMLRPLVGGTPPAQTSAPGQ
jgi:hypothetical protein